MGEMRSFTRAVNDWLEADMENALKNNLRFGSEETYRALDRLHQIAAEYSISFALRRYVCDRYGEPRADGRPGFSVRLDGREYLFGELRPEPPGKYELLEYQDLLCALARLHRCDRERMRWLKRWGDAPRPLGEKQRKTMETLARLEPEGTLSEKERSELARYRRQDEAFRAYAALPPNQQLLRRLRDVRDLRAASKPEPAVDPEQFGDWLRNHGVQRGSLFTIALALAMDQEAFVRFCDYVGEVPCYNLHDPFELLMFVCQSMPGERYRTLDGVLQVLGRLCERLERTVPLPLPERETPAEQSAAFVSELTSLMEASADKADEAALDSVLDYLAERSGYIVRYTAGQRALRVFERQLDQITRKLRYVDPTSRSAGQTPPPISDSAFENVVRSWFGFVQTGVWESDLAYQRVGRGSKEWSRLAYRAAESDAPDPADGGDRLNTAAVQRIQQHILSRKRIGKLRSGVEPVEKGDLVFLSLLNHLDLQNEKISSADCEADRILRRETGYGVDSEIERRFALRDDRRARFRAFVRDTNDLLREAGMPELYPLNLLDLFAMSCFLTEAPKLYFEAFFGSYVADPRQETAQKGEAHASKSAAAGHPPAARE